MVIFKYGEYLEKGLLSSCQNTESWKTKPPKFYSQPLEFVTVSSDCNQRCHCGFSGEDLK